MEGKNMRKIFQYILMAVAMVATASCSNELDDTLLPAENGTLQFVVSDFPAFGEGTQTRAIGTQDAGKTEWVDGDQILVHMYSHKYTDQAMTLTFDVENNTWKSDGGTLNYLDNETPMITAVYAPDCEIKSDKTIGLLEGKKYGEAEYISAKTTISGNTLDIRFERGRIYSRLRIVAEAEQTLTVTTTGFTPASPENVSAPDSYTLVADGKDNAYLYGTFAEGGSVTVKKGDAELATHTFNVTSEQGKSYALYAGKKVDVDLSTLTATYAINDDAYYTFTGTGSYGIKVESGNPKIVMNNANITVNAGSAIDIPSGSTTTIQVIGDNTIGTTKTEFWDAPCGGIFVAEGGTVNITSNGTDNILRAHGTLAAAIGGKYDYDNNESYNAGSINISNVTVYAYTNNFYASAIGAAGEGTCGTINITNAVIYAYGAGDRWTSAPGIGNAWSLLDWSDAIPIVIISNSEVHTFRYNPYSDYIGYLGDESGDTYATGSINCGEGGSATNSTIYCYTGLDATTTDKVVTYYADGNPTEQAAE